MAGRAVDYLVVLLHGRPTGRYDAEGGLLTWREPAPDATVRLDVAVADIADGVSPRGQVLNQSPELRNC